MQDIKYEIEKSKQGSPTLFVYKQKNDKIYLHSKYDPLKEAQTFRERFNQNKYDFIIILGAGLGYHLIPLIEFTNKYEKIIIIDIIKNIDKEIEKNEFTSQLLKFENITLLTGLNPEELKDKIFSSLNLDIIRGIDVIDHAPSIRAFPDYYKKTKEVIKRTIDRKAGSKATHRAFGMLFLRNVIKNYNSFRRMLPVSAFFDKMKDFPCLVITSGPSLEHYIKKIKDYQNNLFIITVDSALKTLLGYGVEPDLFVSIDPQPFIFEHLFGVNTHIAVPVFTVSTHPHVIQQCSMPQNKNIPGILSLNSHPMSQIIEDIFPNVIGSIDSKTGTVAGDAVMASIKIGFKNIGLVGFDFSFPDFKIYPRGTAYQFRFNNINSRFNTSETINFNYIMKSSKGTKYENKFTRKSFLLYREYMENFLKDYKSSIYNLNNKGISFGVPYIKPDSFFGKYCANQINKKKIINDILKKNKTLGDTIDFQMIISTLSNETSFKKFINASLDKDTDQKVDIIKSLFDLIISGNQT